MTTKPQHTPGPWEVVGGSVYKLDPDFGVDVCIANMDRSEPNTRPVERDANARLIASAPMLLEALRWYVQFEEYDDESGNIAKGSQREIALKQARAAIAKATGGDM